MSILLKHVCARGNTFTLRSPWIVNLRILPSLPCRYAKPWIGTPLVPVTKCSSLAFCSCSKDRTSSQNHCTTLLPELLANSPDHQIEERRIRRKEMVKRCYGKKMLCTKYCTKNICTKYKILLCQIFPITTASSGNKTNAAKQPRTSIVGVFNPVVHVNIGQTVQQ